MKFTKNSWIKIMLLLTLLVFSTLIILDYRSTKDFLKSTVERQTQELLNNFISEVDLFTSRRIGDVQLMADYIPYIVDDEKEVAQYLKRQHDIKNYFSALGFIKPDGKIIADDGSRLEVKKRESFLQALQGETLISDVFPLAQDPDVKVTSIVVPVRDENERIIGVLSGLINIEDIIKEITNSFRLSGAVYFLKNGEVIHSYPSERIERENGFAHVNNIDLVQKERYGTIYLDQSGHMLKYGQTVTGWTVVVDSMKNPELEEMENSLLKMLLLVLLTIVVGGLIYYYISYLERQADDRLKKDLLTGLPNRLQVTQDIERKDFEWGTSHLAVYIIRLDRFSELMERFGYQTADQLLLKTSSLLVDYEPRGRSYRLDYALFLFAKEYDTVEGASALGEELVQLLHYDMTIEDELKVNVSASIGGVLIDQDADEEFLENGVLASQESSKAGGNQFTLYNEEIANLNKENRQLVRCLSTALERQEFYMVYQPIYSIEDNRIVGFEALIRWKLPELGEVGPGQFISHLEEDEAIVDTGRWIMNSVARQANEWSQAGYEDFTISVNVSVMQLHHDCFLHDVYSMLEETGVDPSLLIFEVTESVIVEKVDSVIYILRTLNELGIQTAIDDFGTGYSSLSSLTTLPFQYLKVDRAFIQDVERREPGAEAILKGIIDIAKALDQTTVLEGVETLEQMRLLQTFGAQRIQGYFISKPLIVEEAVHMLGKEMDW
ncbi:bifunctional diguanylate cyclase/phosphodiesterase [Sporosarcina obsidiansis]|uniref:bifunctional diguanylate cyclase/phosphodiesterase n=1 Tax=Sporosarcina obsidiansis TaxID=2660748 RepID=UPI00129A2CDC|nr:GGDEF domain-containing protein [Sporosarcina obsidiansis]